MLGGLLLCLIAPWLLLPCLICAVVWLFVFYGSTLPSAAEDAHGHRRF
ncbi:hypothetical protein ACLBOM_37235 [Escherichia coli]